MTPRTFSAALVVTVALALTGCESGSSIPPGAPTLIASRPEPSQVAITTRWNLTQTPTAIKGPDLCGEPNLGLGSPVDLLMAIRRSGESMEVVDDIRIPVSDQVDYLGTVT